MAKIRQVKVPALVGRKEAAKMLGIASENLGRVAQLPAPLQDRGIDGFEVTTGPLWPRSEVEQVVVEVQAAKARRVQEAIRQRERRDRDRERARAAKAKARAKASRAKTTTGA